MPQPCVGTIEDDGRVTIAPKATVSIVPDAATICADDNYTFSASQIVDSNVSSFNWIGGDGTFPMRLKKRQPIFQDRAI